MKFRILLILLSAFSICAFANKSVNQQFIHNGWLMRQVGTVKWIPAQIPGCVHTDLLRNGLIQDPYFRTNEKDLQWIDKKDWEYKTSFEVSDNQLVSDNQELVFEGLDTYADVFLNNQPVLQAGNMFHEWVVNVKPVLKKGTNELHIFFHSPINKGLELLKSNGFKLHAANDQAVNGGLDKDEAVSPFIRKAPYHFGWDWGPRFVTSGIWQPVYLRTWNNLRISDLYIQQQSLTDRKAELKAEVEIQSVAGGEATVLISVNGAETAKQSVELQKGKNTVFVPFCIQNPRRWWTNGLGEAYLYSVSAQVLSSDQSDSLTRNIGLRTLKLINKPDAAGHTFYFELNGIPVFAKGENHIPNDMFPDRCTPEVYEWEIGTAKKSNLNMLRAWGGGFYENDVFYDLCDRNGILVWQDFMFACTLYPGNESFLKSISTETEYQTKRLRNHACLALWCGNNEIDVAWQNFNPNGDWGWKKTYNEAQRKQVWATYDTIFNHILPSIAGKNCPSVPYWQSSPSTLIPQKHANDKNTDGDVHYWGVWWGKHPFEKYAENIGRFMSEYGFQSFPELETVRKYALPQDFDIESEVMKHHQRSSIGNVTIKEYMDMYYRKPADFEKFLYVGQVLQAYGIRFAIEAHRRAMPYNMGSLVWQINDCWPVASWSSSDYFHRWKALQYEIKRSFEPVTISAFTPNDSTSVTIISDKLKPINGMLDMQLCNFSGKVLKNQSLAVTVPANGASCVFKNPTRNISSNITDTFWNLTLKSGNEIIAEKVHYFTNPAKLELPRPQISSKVEKAGGYYVITLKTDKLAKDVYLNFPGTEGFMSDNYFDLLPGTERKIYFTPVKAETAVPALSIMSLTDSY